MPAVVDEVAELRVSGSLHAHTLKAVLKVLGGGHGMRGGGGGGGALPHSIADVRCTGVLQVAKEGKPHLLCTLPPSLHVWVCRGVEELSNVGEQQTSGAGSV